MKKRSSSSSTNSLCKAACFLMILAGSSALQGCDNSNVAPSQGSPDGMQQIQTFFQDFAREILAAYLF